MNITQYYSPFETFKKVISQLYPMVTDLSCDNWDDNVKAIQYDDGIHNRMEYPPAVSWRIGNQRFKYVLKPKFKNYYSNDLISALSGHTSQTKIDYNDQEKIVLDLIKWSVEGKTTEEMNNLLDRL